MVNQKVTVEPLQPSVVPTPRRVAPPQGLWSTVWRRFLRHRLALFGLLVLIILTLGTRCGDKVLVNDFEH